MPPDEAPHLCNPCMMNSDSHLIKNESSQQPFLHAGTESVDNLVHDKERFLRESIKEDPVVGFGLLFKAYYRPLCSHAARFVYSRELAEDLVAEVFEHFWQKRLYAQVKVSFQAYLFTAVRHQALQYLRSEFGKKMAVPLDDLHLESLLPSPQQLLQYDELYLEVEKAIRLLSPPVQKVFMMSRFEGKKNTAIADELQISTKTVEAHITKVLKLLRKALRQQLASALLLLVCLAEHLGNLE